MTIYNEWDTFAASWLEELIADRLIAEGIVDARDIRDIIPLELDGQRQVHLFAGIGVWSLALRLAGVADDAEVWTASCPCQPFSAAGKRGGTADERHLWPAAFHLIRHCRPRLVMGEQVASPDGLAWLDVVLADLEAEGYTCRAVDLCAAGVGAPHIRQRLYWLAYTGCDDRSGRRADGEVAASSCGAPSEARQRERLRDAADDGGATDRLADAERRRLKELKERDGGTEGRRSPVQSGHDALRRGEPERMGHSIGSRLEGHARHGDGGDEPGRVGADQAGPVAATGDARRPGPTNGLWQDPDWLLCRDAKWRPVEPGSFPLADARAFRNRVAALRGAGNAINVAQAEAFIRANFDVIGGAS